MSVYWETLLREEEADIEHQLLQERIRLAMSPPSASSSYVKFPSLERLRFLRTLDQLDADRLSDYLTGLLDSGEDS